MTAVLAPQGRAAPLERVSCYAVEGAADPGLLPRVLELFVKRGLVPDRCFAQCHGRQGDQLLIDLQIAGLDAQSADNIARALRQIPMVTAVLTSDKLRA
jgi:acetolactate synthase small subunit